MFSIYHSTNFFIRGAITEFFAVGILNSLVGLWILALESKNKICYGAVVGLGMASIYYIHPITAMLGTIFFACLIAATVRRALLEEPKRVIVMAAGIALMSAAVALPFVYIVITKKPLIDSSPSIEYIAGIDDFFARISFVPLDKRVYKSGNGTSTPNLAAAVNMMLYSVNLYLSVANVRSKKISEKQKYGIIILNFIICSLLIITTVDSFGRFFPVFLNKMQFVYRMVSYIDLCIVCGVTYNLSVWKNVNGLKNERLKPVLGMAVIFLMQMLVIRYYQIDAIGDTLVNPDAEYQFTADPAHLAPTFYGARGYYVYDGCEDVDFTGVNEVGRTWFDVGVNALGVAEARAFTTDLSGRLEILGLHPHPWNRIYLDGERYDGDMVYDSKSDTAMHIWVEKGSHTLEYKFEPDKTYNVLRYAAKVATASMLGMLCVFLASIFIKKGGFYVI